MKDRKVEVRSLELFFTRPYGPLNNYHLYTVLALLTYTRSVFGQRSRNK